MGGRGSGGRRPGTGRKPKAAHLRGIDGGAARRPDVAPPADAAQADAPSAPVVMPAHLTDPEAVKVWAELAPLATAARTLTAGTARALALLCRMVVLEQKLAGMEPGGAGHRGVLQRVSALMLQFNLAPCGKPLYEPAKPAEQPKTGLRRFISA